MKAVFHVTVLKLRRYKGFDKVLSMFIFKIGLILFWA